MNTKPLLKIENLTKIFRSHWTFRPRVAVKDVSITIHEGETYGFLGHNGAGKTTTIKCIVGLIRPTLGSVTYYSRTNSGERPLSLLEAENRKELSFLPEQPYFYDDLTVAETLNFFAALHGYKATAKKERVSEALATVRLDDRANDKVRSLSKGLQQRLGFAQALINNPSLLLLDEPFSGLDPLGRAEFRALILDLKRKGTTIFISSHILPDIQDICDRVAIMAKGELKRELSLNDLANETFSGYRLAFIASPERLLNWQTEMRRIFASNNQLLSALNAGIEAQPRRSGVETNLPQDLSQQSSQHASQKSIHQLPENTTEGAAQESVHTFDFATYEEASEATQIALRLGLTMDSFTRKSKQLEEIFIDTLKGEELQAE